MSHLRVHRILAPVDLGHSSQAAVRMAQMFALRLGAKLTLMYVNDALTLQSYNEIYTGFRELPPEQEDMMEDAVRAWAGPLVQGLPYDVLVVADDPPRAIATAAERLEADLVIVGTHGRHGWNRVITGSMAEAILHATDRPVIAVPQNAPSPDVSNIVCPVSFTEVGRRAAKTACCMSRALGAQLHVVHVAEHPLSDLPGRLREWIGPLVDPSCDFREMIVHGGGVAERVGEIAGSLGAEMLVVGARKRKLTHARATIGTTTERLLRVAPIPVLSVVHPFAPAEEMEKEEVLAGAR